KVRREWHPAGVRLQASYPDHLPLILADDLRLKQILMNIIGNAVKFTRQGSVTLDAQTSDSVVRFSVADTGPGIPKSTLEKLFQAYSQASPDVVREYGGTGLGLSISRQFVELQGGKIWA